MIAAVFAVLLMQQPAASSAGPLPEWAKADPFAFERARCSALVRGETPLNVCQAEVRRLLEGVSG